MSKRSMRSTFVLLGIPTLCVAGAAIAAAISHGNQPAATSQAALELNKETSVQLPTTPQPAENQSSDASVSSVNVESTGGKPHVTVNGQHIAVPDQGSVDHTVQSDNGSTHVNVTVQNDSTGNSSSYSSSVVTVNDSSSSTSDNDSQ